MDENHAVAEFRSVLANARGTLGFLLFHLRRVDEAEREYDVAVAIMHKLVSDHPTVIVYHDRLAYALLYRGDVIRSLGRAAEAKDLYKRAVALKELRVHENPTDMEHRYVLAIATRRLGLARRDLGDPAGAAADTRHALELCEGLPSNWDYIEKAFCHSALASLAGRPGSGVSAAEGASEADQAMEWLRKALATGYRNGNELRLDSAMNPLRSRRDFQLLMMDLAFPADPFAQGR